MATEPVPSVSVLLIDAKDQGHTATLVMELVSPGEGHIYPCAGDLADLLRSEVPQGPGERPGVRREQTRPPRPHPGRSLDLAPRGTAPAARDLRTIDLSGPGPAASLTCAVDGCEARISPEKSHSGGPGLHYKIRSGLKRSGISSRRAVKIRFGSPIGRATRRRTSFRPSVVSNSMSPMAI